MIKNIQGIIQAYQVNKTNNNIKSTQNQKLEDKKKKDEVVLSDKGVTFQKALRAAMEVPDTNIDRVNETKKQIEEGNYKFDADKVAEKILEYRKFMK